MKGISQLFGGRGIPALFLRTLALDDDEERLVGQMRAQIRKFAAKNAIKNDFYEGKQKTRQLDIAVPPGLQDLAVSMGWPGTAVDVLEERLDFLGWTSVQDLMGLDDVFRENSLGVEAGRGHLDALITGTDFVTVGRGDTNYGEPDVLVTVESASSATTLRNYRARRSEAGLSQTRNEFGAVEMETLYLPNSTIGFARNERTKKLEVISRDDHNAGRVFMARLVNRDRASDLDGRSEITRPVMYYTDAAIRTMLGMEINREFYTAPSRYALGADPEQFGVNEDSTESEKRQAGWKAAMGRFNVIPRTEDGLAPTVGSFTQRHRHRTSIRSRCTPSYCPPRPAFRRPTSVSSRTIPRLPTRSDRQSIDWSSAQSVGKEHLAKGGARLRTCHCSLVTARWMQMRSARSAFDGVTLRLRLVPQLLMPDRSWWE